MPKHASKKLIYDLCINGIKTAEKLYSEWSGGFSIRSAPESLAQIEIAKQLNKKSPWVTLEESVSNVIDASGAEPRGKKPRNNLGRIDIVTWRASDKPRMAIEIKIIKGHKSINSDARRLRKLTRRCPSVQNGLIVGYRIAAKKETLTSSFKSIAIKSKTKLVKDFVDIETANSHGEPRYLGAACFLVNG